MRGNSIPLTDHVIRYISPIHIDYRSDGTERVSASGFDIRTRDNGKLSCHWLECFQGTTEEKIQRIREVSRLELRKNGRFVMLNVGDTIYAVKFMTFNQIELQIISEPLDAYGIWPSDPSHALIVNMPDQNSPSYDRVKDILRKTVLNFFPPTES